MIFVSKNRNCKESFNTFELIYITTCFKTLIRKIYQIDKILSKKYYFTNFLGALEEDDEHMEFCRICKDGG